MGGRADRYREIVEVLSVHGFGFAVGAMGMAGRFPFRRLPGHERNRVYSQPEHLRLALEQLGPTFVKMGQLLSTRPDLLPHDYVLELSKLQDEVAPVPAAAVLDVITDELGGTTAFDSLTEEPLASASIGQAHAGTVDGVDVVVKVRRPGVVETVERDLEILGDLAVRASRRWEAARDYDLVELTAEFGSTLRHELDYLREGRNAERFAASFASDRDVHIPRVLWERTTSRVLTLERIRGIKVTDVAALDAAGVDRAQLAVRAATVLCKMVFEDGFFHADPHPGNFFVEPGGVLGIIDFGMVGELDDALRARLGDLLIALMRSDADQATDAVLALNRSTAPVDRGALRDDVQAMVERFSGHSLVDFPVSELVKDIQRTLHHHHLRMPSDLALLFKALLMAEGLGARLDPDFQFITVLAPYAERLMMQRVSPAAISRWLADLATELRDAGRQAPRALRGVLHVLERGGFDLHLRSNDLDRLLLETDRLGNRVVAGLLAAGLINGLGRVVATTTGRRPALRDASIVAGAGALGALAAYLVGTATRHGTGRR